MSEQVEPRVGMGATLCYVSDQRACTVIEVVRFASGLRRGKVRSVTLQADTATPLPGHNAMSEYQPCTYAPNPDGATWVANVRSNGRFYVGGHTYVYFGERREYRDPSF
jgi:hypothetical protein